MLLPFFRKGRALEERTFGAAVRDGALWIRTMMESESGHASACCDDRMDFDSIGLVGYTRAMELTHDTSAAPPVIAPPAQDDDALYCELIARIAMDDENALGRLYDGTAGRLYALALRITRNAQDAEETVLDVFHQVWRQADQYDATRGRVLAWIMTICRSRALDVLRRRETAETHPDPDALRDNDMDPAADPQHWIELFQRDSAVRRALEQLPTTQRELLGLAFLRGLSHQEITDETGMPLGTVKTHIRKALSALQHVLPNPFAD